MDNRGQEPGGIHELYCVTSIKLMVNEITTGLSELKSAKGYSY